MTFQEPLQNFIFQHRLQTKSSSSYITLHHCLLTKLVNYVNLAKSQ